MRHTKHFAKEGGVCVNCTILRSLFSTSVSRSCTCRAFHIYIYIFFYLLRKSIVAEIVAVFLSFFSFVLVLFVFLLLFFTPTLSHYHSHSVFCVPVTNLTYMVYSEYSSQFVIYKPACCNTFIFYQHCRALLQLRLNNFVKVKSY